MENSIESSRDYKPGDVILKFKPQIHCVSDECKSLFCDNCLKRSDDLKKCSKCLQMYYCHKECQQNDWKCHEYECKLYRNKMEAFGDLMRLQLRLWLRFDSDPSFSFEKYPAINRSEICLNDIRVDYNKLKRNYQTMLEMGNFIHEMEGFGLKINKNKFIKFFGIMNCSKTTIILYNSNEIHPKEHFIKVGYGLVFQLTKHIHSCVPNACHLVNGVDMQFRAIKPIKAGEKVTIALIDLELNKVLRQIEMKENEFELCTCERCKFNLDKDIDYEEFYKLKLINEKYWLENEGLKFLFGINPEYVIDWQFILYTKAIYGEYHPSVTRALVISYVYFAENSLFASKPMLKIWYKEIEPYFQITHGKNDPYYQNFKKFVAKYINID